MKSTNSSTPLVGRPIEIRFMADVVDAISRGLEQGALLLDEAMQINLA
ncbi:MAG TPA: hypothetical protein VJS42_13390 [Steroidobacteraceae bacterium]|nr:hypothetical protein [Steroidobacteraceae bacterium]